MSVQTLLYDPPCLCGCRLSITGEFASDPTDGVIYQRPRPGSITSIEIVSVCPEHEPALHVVPDVSHFFEPEREPRPHPGVPLPEGYSALEYLASITGTKLPRWQARGYLDHSKPELHTPSERLFTVLCDHKSQTHGLACGCVGYQHKKRAADGSFPVVGYKDHPVHTRHCPLHADDDHEMTTARKHHDSWMTLVGSI
jgi:hypothetical protein